jgi:transcription initiation factor TFIIIB Brf1 subunit/transcription initiation factor TFIIB
VAPPVIQDNAVARTPLLRTANELDRALGLGLPVRDASAYLSGLLAEFSVPAAVADRARELVEQAQVAGLGTTAGRHPEGLAAACLVVAYDVAGRERPFMLTDVIKRIEPSAATLRERRQDVRELLEQA